MSRRFEDKLFSPGKMGFVGTLLVLLLYIAFIKVLMGCTERKAEVLAPPPPPPGSGDAGLSSDSSPDVYDVTARKSMVGHCWSWDLDHYKETWERKSIYPVTYVVETGRNKFRAKTIYQPGGKWLDESLLFLYLRYSVRVECPPGLSAGVGSTPSISTRENNGGDGHGTSIQDGLRAS